MTEPICWCCEKTSKKLVPLDGVLLCLGCAVHLNSSWNQRKCVPLPEYGARGLMQMIPTTWREP